MVPHPGDVLFPKFSYVWNFYDCGADRSNLHFTDSKIQNTFSRRRRNCKAGKTVSSWYNFRRIDFWIWMGIDRRMSRPVVHSNWFRISSGYHYVSFRSIRHMVLWIFSKVSSGIRVSFSVHDNFLIHEGKIRFTLQTNTP